MTVYLWILSGIVLLIFLVWFFFGRQELARISNLIIDLVLVVAMCVVFGLIIYFQLQDKNTEGELHPVVETVVPETIVPEPIVIEPIVVEPKQQETTVAETPEPVQETGEVTVSGNVAQPVTQTPDATGAR